MKNKDIKLLIFDFDGTLADTVPHIINCTRKCIEKFGLGSFTQEDVKKYNGAVLADVLKMLGATDEQLPEIKKYYADVFLEDMSDIYLYDNVKTTLEKLKDNGYILTLASNRGRNTVIPLLKELNIDNLFDKIICESDVENKKPNPDMVNLILHDMDMNNTQALVIGDTRFDVLMGKNAKCDTCLVCYENEVDKRVVELEPDYIICKLEDILNLFRN